MQVMVLGSGGREHAIVWAVARSEKVDGVLAVPGNPGTAAEPGVTNVAIDINDPEAVTQLAIERGVDLVVVGPEAPLVAGVANALRAAGIATVGPNADGARLEGSKAFAKEVMTGAGVRTAAYAHVSTSNEIDEFCDSFEGDALVVKADGLAAGKGVIVCDSVEEARREAHRMLEEQTFGDASAELVLEERLEGIETSYIVLAAGETFVAFPTSQDHKRLLAGDEGPNTGGMGAYSPAPFVTESMKREIESEVIRPTLAELRRRGIDFRGVLYAGIMLTEKGTYVLEFNVRLGDPEAQVLLASLESDLVPALVACANGDLEGVELNAGSSAAIIVAAAEGYPVKPIKGATIEGVDAANKVSGVRVFHAGTKLDGDKLVVNGGRVLGVTAAAATPDDAIATAYKAMSEISWPGMQHRSDIGHHLSD